jgi:peptidyl-prolyl cis-trans isomerase SurA
VNALILMGLMSVAPPADGRVIERIVAVVDDRVVLLSEVERVVDDYMRAEPVPTGKDPKAVRAARWREVLDTLIADKLLEEEVKKLRIEVTEAEIDRVVDDTKKRSGLDDVKFRQALAQQGLSYDEYREGMKKQLTKAKIVELKVKKRVQVSDQDVKSTIAKRAAMLKDEFRVRARHILFLVPKDANPEPARLKALEALARVKAGEKFEAVAREVSEGPSGPAGGALGVFGRGEMVPAFERAAFATEPGGLAGPVKTQFGWHLILVEERVKVATGESEALVAQVRQDLYQREIEREFSRYLEELRRDAYIEVREAL